MPLVQEPRLQSNSNGILNIDQPGYGGLNIDNLEYEQDNDQSPSMLNMMYRNGTFSKRYGQQYTKTYANEIHDSSYYNGAIVVHSGTGVYSGDTLLATIEDRKGTFFQFNKKLYYVMPPSGDNGKIYEYNGTTWGLVTPYIPTTIINAKPDLSEYSDNEKYNILTGAFTSLYHGDGTSTVYKIYSKYPLTSTTPIAKINGVTQSITYNQSAKTVTFASAPATGVGNVEITAYEDESYLASEKRNVLNCKYFVNYGGNNNSRVFCAGNGNSTYYYSGVFDASYFPDDCYGMLGNSKEDITGMATQYDVLIVFKPSEIYSLYYYTRSDSNSYDESAYGTGAFTSALVNGTIGCDCPNTIQLINNQLTWLNSSRGIMTLVSTEITDERDVRPISQNINGGARLNGLLYYASSNKDSVVSVDYENKYILTFYEQGISYMWDYGIAPYSNTGRITSDGKRTAWFKFDNTYQRKYMLIDTELFYVNDGVTRNMKIGKFNNQFNDEETDGTHIAINSSYRTPMLQFNSSTSSSTTYLVPFLKNIKNIWVQVRTDIPSVITIKYITDENPFGYIDDRAIITNGSDYWSQFSWNNFVWSIKKSSIVNRRRVGFKKVQQFAIEFTNNELNSDMSISHLSIEYEKVRTIR